VAVEASGGWYWFMDELEKAVWMRGWLTRWKPNIA